MRIAQVKSRLAGGAHFVEITTENGITGLGQSGCWAYPEAVDAIMPRFADYLVGEDARRIEHHWHQLYRMGPFRGSVLGGAVSAIDIALWDIKGQAFDAPVWDLLGGHCRDRIRLHKLILGDFEPGVIATEVATAVEEGFTAVKFDPIPSDCGDRGLDSLIREVTARVEAARDAAGRDVDIVLEFHRRLTPMQAIPVIEALKAFNVLFIEDPIQIDSIEAQGSLAARINLPMGNGERLNTIWEFRELLQQGGPQYLRPDLGLAGGISHCRKIAAIAEAHHASLVAHNFLGPVLTAASVHLSAAVPNIAVQEYSLIDESQPASAAYDSCLVREGGYLRLPERPGLGVRLKPEADSVWLSPNQGHLHDIPRRKDGSIAYAV